MATLAHVWRISAHQGAPVAHHSEARKCGKTRTNDLSINMKDIGVLGFWGIVTTGHHMVNINKNTVVVAGVPNNIVNQEHLVKEAN
jgi:hypothetical protein